MDTRRVDGMCAHALKRLAIEGCDNPSCVQRVMKKTKESNQKLGKTHWTINQIITLRLDHDKIQAQWVSNILSKNMLEKIWWCICSKMESWNQIICYSKGRKHAHVMCCNPLLEECGDDTQTSEMGTWESSRTLEISKFNYMGQNTLHWVLFISLKSYRSVNVENGLAWAIWTFVTQVMAKRKAMSQINSLTIDH